MNVFFNMLFEVIFLIKIAFVPYYYYYAVGFVTKAQNQNIQIIQRTQ